jgi:hypothetical protein
MEFLVRTTVLEVMGGSYDLRVLPALVKVE